MTRRILAHGSTRALSCAAAFLFVCLLWPQRSVAQEDEGDTTTITWWVIGTGGILDAVNSDGDTVSGTLGQPAIDSTAMDDSTYGKRNGQGHTQPSMTAWFGFWPPTSSQLEESSPDAAAGVSGAFALTNHPDPFTDRTTISYLLPRDANVRLEIFDAIGKRVRVLLDEAQSAGAHRATWNGNDDAGSMLPGGAYFYRLELATTVSQGQQSGDGVMHLVR